MQAVKQAVKTETAQQRPAGAQMALRILLSFVKIGAFTFGSGWSIVAQMEQEFVDKRGWMTKSDLLELIAVGKSLPGIMVVNITMLFGYQMAGALGGVCAAVGLCIPAVITLTVVTAIYDAIKDNYWVWSALRGVQCAVAPIIGGAAISLGKDALRSAAAIMICAAAFVLCYFTSISNLTLVIAGVVIALVWMGVSEHGLIQLFIAFAKIGFTSFGGTSMIPLIMDEMSSHGWMTDADLTNLIAIAEMTPGSLGVNAATFAGTKTAGMLGGIFAVLGVLSPTLTLTLLAAVFFQKFRTSKVMSYIMRIVKPICIGMVLGVLVGLCRQSYLTEAGGISLSGLFIGILCFVLLQKFKLSVPKVIGIAAALGLVCFGVF